MKLKICFILSLISIYSLLNCLNLKVQTEIKNKIYDDKLSELEKMKFKEQGWGDVLNTAAQGLNNVKNTAQQITKQAQGNIADTLTGGVNAAAKNANKGLGEIAKATGIDTSGVQGSVKQGAKELNTAINCFFGKCPTNSNGLPPAKPNTNSNTSTNTNNTPVKPNPNQGQISNPLIKPSPTTALTPTPTPSPTPKIITGYEHCRNKTVDDNSFTLNKKQIQSHIDPRYNVMRAQDEFMNNDNTIRFIATDTTDMESYSLKLYFKGKPSNGVFFSQKTDPTYMLSLNDCKNHKVIINRLYDKPSSNSESVKPTDVPKYSDVNLPQCLTVQDSGNLKTNYINIYSLPEGVRLDVKCLKGESLNNVNSCVPFMRLISSGLLHALDVFNMGNSFFKHGNIIPNNIYLTMRNDTQRVFLDNMMFDNNKYDDVNQKPFRSDMNMMADTFLQLLTGTKKTIIKGVVQSTFHIFHAVKRYFFDNNINVSLYSSALNMPNNMKIGDGKCVTMAELDYKLQKSFFNFIYRLKCTGTNPVNQFMDINQALNHDFIKSGLQTGVNASGEQWDSLPSDY